MTATVNDPKAVILRSDDTVAVAARPIPRGFVLQLGGRTIEVREPIGLGHKVALADIATGEPVRKYGQIIGFASKPIAAGSLVHVHNLKADLFERDYAFATEHPETPRPDRQRTFRGYLRPDGRVGTRNYIAVVSTVNCSASTSRYVADKFRDGAWRKDFPNIDGVFAITHKGGCGLPFEGLDHQILERVLAGFRPSSQRGGLRDRGARLRGEFCLSLGRDATSRHAGRGQRQRGEAAGSSAAHAQHSGRGGDHPHGRGGRACRLRAHARGQFMGKERAASLQNSLAMECGGSDGNSGVTANPALGAAADLLVAQGGTAILGETTEIYGAEHLLTRRAVSREVGQKLVDRIKWWEWYTGVFGARIDNNPSPGNKAGGLTTIYEKSLGALAKAGSTALVDVVPYAARVDTPGLVFMDTPGYDPPCTTGLIASGANVLVFTTGRGSVLGLKPTPCIKLATNTPMYERMIADMDLDAGPILEGEPVESVGRRLFDLILEVASGSETKSERAGVGEEEFAPWTIGPTL